MGHRREAPLEWGRGSDVERIDWGHRVVLRWQWISMAAAADGSLCSGFLDREPHDWARYWIRVVVWGDMAPMGPGRWVRDRVRVTWSVVPGSTATWW
jgi:hypothetical protein